MNVKKAMQILTDVISISERNNKFQGMELYRSALEILKDENSTKAELERLYRNFCGYLAHGEFTDEEYQKLLQLLECLEK